MRVSGRGLVIKSNKILLIDRINKNDKYFSIPGGGVEKGETTEKALIREFLEETSIRVEPVDLLFETNNIYKGVERKQVLYLCKYLKGHPKSSDKELRELQGNPEYKKFVPKWVNISKVLKSKIQPSVLEDFVKTYLSNIK